MPRSLNNVTLIGNVGQDPEIRTTQAGAKVASFSLATSREWKDGRGERQSKTEWHRCSVWSAPGKHGLAGVVEDYVKKGDKLYAEGRIEYRTWDDKDGNTRYATEIVVSEILMLGGKGTSVAASDDAGDDDEPLPF